MEVSRILEGGCTANAMVMAMFALGVASLKHEIPKKE
jgi:hypothetical protein